MLELLKALLPQIEEYISVCDAEHRAAVVRADQAREEEQVARAKSAAADHFLAVVRDVIDGTFHEVPL